MPSICVNTDHNLYTVFYVISFERVNKPQTTFFHMGIFQAHSHPTVQTNQATYPLIQPVPPMNTNFLFHYTPAGFCSYISDIYQV